MRDAVRKFVEELRGFDRVGSCKDFVRRMAR